MTIKTRPASERSYLDKFQKEFVNRIHCGDSRELLQGFPPECIHLAVTSPPYWSELDYGFEGQIGQSSYEQYLEDLLLVWKETERILVPNGKLCINTPILPVRKNGENDSHTRQIKNINNDIENSILTHTALQRYSLFVWQKQTTEKMFGSYPYPPNIYENNTIEFINVFVKPGKPRKLPPEVKESSRLSQDEWMDLTRQVWFIYPEDVARKGPHPAPFPEKLPARLIAMYTFRGVPAMDFQGDIVLDMFCGTGATCVAAKKLGRRFIGIDGSSRFCEIGRQRLQKAHPVPGYDLLIPRFKLANPRQARMFD